MKKTLLILALVLLGLSAGYVSQRLSQLPVDHIAVPVQKVPEFAPGFRLNDPKDNPHSSEEWKDKVMLVNFWATWCPPCLREIPAFMQLQDKYSTQGLVIIGIAIDNKQAVIDFSDPMDINYPILLADKEGLQLASAYGNHLGALPYTAIVDRNGRIVSTHRGELSFEAAERLIKPLL